MQIQTTFSMRELSFGEVLDVGFKLFRRLVWKFLGLYLIVGIPLVAIYAVFFIVIFKNPNVAATFLTFMFIVYIPLILVAMGIVKGSIIHMTAEKYLNREARIVPAINFAWTRFWAYLGTAILWGLSIILGLFCLILPAIFLAIIFTFIFHAVFIDKLSAIDAMKRSWELFKGNAGKVVGYFFLALLIKYMAGLIPYLTLIPLFTFNTSTEFMTTAAIVSYIIYIVFAFVVFTYIPIVWTVLYFDSRCKIEAFDLEILAKDIQRSKSKVVNGQN